MSRLRALPTGFWLAALVLLGAAAWSIEGLRLENWVVQTDELQYVRNAMSIADGLAIVPTIHGEHYGSFSLFAFLMAPLYAVFDTRTAFDLAHVAGALAMSSAAIPGYLLARQLTDSRLAALLAAALCISVPWFSLVTMLRTEVVAYPAFLWAILALQRSVAEPSTRHDVLALAALGLALLARTQLLAVALAYPLAIVLHETGYALRGRPRTSLRAAIARSITHHPLVAAAAALGVALAVSGAAAGALGSYEVVGRRELMPEGVWDQARWQLAIVVIAIGGIPVALAFAWMLDTVVRPPTRAAHAYASVAVTAGFALAIQASGFVIQFVEGVNYQDRYFFYVAPLILIAMVGWLTAGRRPRLATIAGAVAGALAFFWLATRHDFRPFSSYSYSPASAFNRVWYGRMDEIADALNLARSTQDFVRWGGLALCLAVPLWARRVRPRTALLIVCGAVIVFGAIQGGYIVDKIVPTQASRLATTDWVDDALPMEAHAGVFAAPVGAPWIRDHVVNDASPWWNVEFWNKRIDRAYTRGFFATGFPSLRLNVDTETGALQLPERPRPYLVSLSGRPDVGFRGRVVARQRPLELVRLERPYAADWATAGLLGASSIRPLTQAEVSVFPARTGRPRGVRLEIALQAPPRIVEPQRFWIRGERSQLSGRIEPEAVAIRRVSVCVRDDPARIRIRAGRAYVALPLGRVGLRIARIVARPDPAACG